MLDKELLERFQMLIGMMENLATKDDLKRSETRINLKIENEVTRKIESLFDGYKLTHEKQWELERRTDELQNQVNDLAARLEALENRTA